MALSKNQSGLNQSGFTAVELLITLFVAAAFLIASYTLFNLVVKDGGATRAESRAANVAYDYLRQYAASATTIPCSASSPLNDAPLSVDGLVDVSINVTVSCLPDGIDSLSKVQADVTYNHPEQTVSYATYTSSAGASTTSDITNGLVGWWKLNGSANNSVGSTNGVLSGPTSTTGQNGNSDNAYNFGGNASGAIINTSSTFGLQATNVTISTWVNNPTASNSGQFVHVGTSNGFGIGIGNTSTSDVGTKLMILFDGNRWIPTTAVLGTGWHHVVLVISTAGVPTVYLDGVSGGSYPGINMNTASGNTSIGGLNYASGHFFSGSIDDVRLYNRALPLADILALYSAGAQ